MKSILAATAVALLCATCAQSKTIAGRYVTVTVGDTVFDVTSFGAHGDGRTDDSQAIQRALDAAKGAGGGTVVVPAGRTFLFRNFSISGDHTELRVEGTLLLTNDYAHWPLDVKAAIVVVGRNNVAITGSGTIDGQGAVWWENLRNKFRPKTLAPSGSNTLIVSGVTVKDCPFHCLEMYSNNTEIFGVTITAPASTGIANPSHNTDGIDIHGHDFWVHDCDISVGDDNVAIHTSRVLVENCRFGTGHGASIGSLCSEKISGITVRNVNFTGTTCGARIKTVQNCDGSLTDVHFEDLTLNNVFRTLQVTMFYTGSSAKPTGGVFQLRDIHFDGIQSNSPKSAGEFLCDPKSPCGISMNNVVQTGRHLSYRCSDAVGTATGTLTPSACITSGQN
eukprot:m51a1_g1471 putative probable polygalacturonase (392) ;mRNA; r:250096-251327